MNSLLLTCTRILLSGWRPCSPAGLGTERAVLALVVPGSVHKEAALPRAQLGWLVHIKSPRESGAPGGSFQWRVSRGRPGLMCPYFLPSSVPHFPEIPNSALLAMLMVPLSFGGATPWEGGRRWQPPQQEPWGAGDFSKPFRHRGPPLFWLLDLHEVLEGPPGSGDWGAILRIASTPGPRGVLSLASPPQLPHLHHSPACGTPRSLGPEMLHQPSPQVLRAIFFGFLYLPFFFYFLDLILLLHWSIKLSSSVVVVFHEVHTDSLIHTSALIHVLFCPASWRLVE